MPKIVVEKQVPIGVKTIGMAYLKNYVRNMVVWTILER